MDSVKMKGRTVDDAVSAALEVLKLQKEEVEVRVISEGKSGVLGMFGGEDAEVEVFKKGEAAEYAKHFLQEILNKMGFMAIVYDKGCSDGAYQLEIKGEDLGLIIGKDGAGLDALQKIVATATSKRMQGRVYLVIDAAGYKKNKISKIEDMARSIATDVAMSGKEKILDPMSAAERRTVHMALSGSKEVHTYSVGVGADRSTVIAPGAGEDKPK